MLKLVKIYSNLEKTFPAIEFHDGLNIVFANVTKDRRDKSSHSLGKTTLIDVINFALLKKIDNKSFLKKTDFEKFVFFLEIEYDTNRFVTVRRPVVGKTSIKKTSKSAWLQSTQLEEWDYANLGLDQAKETLNSILNLTAFDTTHFHYRTGLRYCFRKQTQYEETFKVNSSRETDAQWKPYLADLLGIDPNLVLKKYEKSQQVTSIENAIKELQSLPSESAQSLEAEIAQIEAHINRLEGELEKFDFRNADAEVNSELIDEVSTKLSDLNSELYGIDQRLKEISGSMNTEFSFDLEKVVELFNEVKINFPEQLSRSYRELISLNQQMSEGRRERLIEARKKLLLERENVEKQIAVVSKEQSSLATALIQKDAFVKFKQMQGRLSAEQSRVAVLRERVSTLDKASFLTEKLQDAKVLKNEAERELTKATRVNDNERMKKALTMFSSLVESILGLSAFFYTEVNKEGNLDFKIGLKDQTSVNDGFSYKRTLSAIFDIVILILHSHDSFYRFCYHDGLLESLDDRVKLKLISEMRKVANQFGLQLIISVLDSDIPETETGNKIYFPEAEIIRHLDDSGDSGRLFRMRSF